MHNVFLSVKDIARALGWSPRRTRAWLWRAGVLERRFGTVVTTPERIASAFPEVYRRLLDEQPEDLDDD